MILPGVPMPNVGGLPPGYSIRLVSDDVMLCFGAEDIVAICDRRVPLRIVDDEIKSHQLERLEQAAPLETLYTDRRHLLPWLWPWRGPGERTV